MSTPQLTSEVAYIGAIVKHVLEELVQKNQEFGPAKQPLVVFGPADDAANAMAPAIYWAPLREQFADPQRTGAAGAPGPLRTRIVPISFLLFGGVEPEGTYSTAEAPYHDCDLTEILLSKLVNCVHRLASQQSYELDAVTWFNSGRTGIGMSCELVLAVRLPLIREDNPTLRHPDGTPVHITKVKATAEIAHHDDE